MALLLRIAGSVLSAGCPPPEDILPCKCSEEDRLLLQCEFENISLDKLKRILHVFDRRKRLDVKMYYIKLGSVPSRFFENLNIRRIFIYKGSLDRLAEDGKRPFTDLEDTLEVLYIGESLMETNVMTKLPLDHLHRLVDLILERNSVTELDNDWFANGPSALKSVHLFDCRIVKLGDRAFANLGNLETFSLVGNRFGSIQRSMFPNPATSLRTLKLNNNMLEKVPEDFFSGMPSLRVLFLRENRFTVLPEDTFMPIWEQLVHIYLIENPLICDDHSLEWMSKATKHVGNYYLEGICLAPPERSGRSLKDVIDEKQFDL